MQNFFSDIQFTRDGPSAQKLFRYLPFAKQKHKRAPCNAVYLIGKGCKQEKLIKALKGRNIVTTVGGNTAATTFYLTDNGELWGSGQSMKQMHFPSTGEPIQIFTYAPVIDVSASNCSNSALVLTHEGLYRIGNLTIDDMNKLPEPLRVELPSPYTIHDIKKISMGGVSNEEFYGILFNNGHLYLAGEGCNYNQLPNSNTKCQFTELTTHVKDMNCGGWHTTYKTYSNELYAMGFNHDGRCALGHSNKTTKPERVKLPFTSGIKSLENGCFSAVLTDDGKVWVAGRSYARTTEDKFEQVKSLGQYFIVKIVVSVYCVLCLSRDGKVFAFGSVEDQDAWPSSSSVAIHLKQFDNIRVVDIGSAGPQNFTVMVWE